MTQDKTVYQVKAKFILVRIEQFEINTVYCVELFLKVNENRLHNHHGVLSTTAYSTINQ